MSCHITLLLLALPACTFCWCDRPRSAPLAPENRAEKADVVFKALLVDKHIDKNQASGVYPSSFVGEFLILDVYKGVDMLAATMGMTGISSNLRDRSLNVSHMGDVHRCWNSPSVHNIYIVLLEAAERQDRKNPEHPHLLVASYQEPFGAIIDFSEDVEDKIFKAIGLSLWSEWGPCTHSCGGGHQKRTREGCTKKNCPSSYYCSEERACNSFKCSMSTNTLAVSDSRYFKPFPSEFHRVAGRGPDAWLLAPGSYLLLPFSQAFGKDFPDDFTVFLTLRPTEESEGIIFSVNARNSRREYLSLELNDARLELVHSGLNGSRVIALPGRITDGKWHQLSVSLNGGSVVKTYLDCQWVYTQVLGKDTLRIPDNADLIVGYMFQGEIEQLTVVNSSSSSSSLAPRQCAPKAIPLTESNGESNDTDIYVDSSLGTGSQDEYLEEEYVDLDSESEPGEESMASLPLEVIPTKDAKAEVGTTSTNDDEDDDGGYEGSGSNEAEWSPWSECIFPCSTKTRQFRSLTRCPTCPEEVETRKCRQKQNCLLEVITREDVKNFRSHHRERRKKDRGSHVRGPDKATLEHKTSCLPDCANGGVCLGGNRCSCAHGFSGPGCLDRTCAVECLNGGMCSTHDGSHRRCICKEGFYGKRCQNRYCHRYVAVQEPVRHVFRRVVEVEYATLCADGQPCTKTRPEHRTSTRTAYRTRYKCAEGEVP